MTLGVAAGVASALAVQRQTQPRALDAAVLQAALRQVRHIYFTANPRSKLLARYAVVTTEFCL